MEKIKTALERRAEIIRAVRGFFQSRRFLEVETPLRIPAPAPEPHILAIPADGWFLQTSPELCMKRLLAAGYARIFQICKCFRKNERGRRHLEEFTMLEWYAAGATYHDLMNQCEDLILSVFAALKRSGPLQYQGNKIDLTRPWPRISVTEAFERFASMDLTTALSTDRFDEVTAFEIEPRLGMDRPVFLTDYPAGASSLAAPQPENPNLAQRFELYISGLELCNGVTELTDAAEQKKRFETEIRARKTAGQPVCPMPERFLDALSFMPEAAGNALGIDRLVMLLTDAECIDAVVAFSPEAL